MNTDMTRHYTPDPEIGLFGGRWIPTGRGTVRWVQERTPVAVQKVDRRRSPRVLDCQICFTTFTGANAQARYCSDECRAMARKITRSKSDKARKPKRNCMDCGGPVFDRGRTARRCRSCAIANRDAEGKWAA